MQRKIALATLLVGIVLISGITVVGLGAVGTTGAIGTSSVANLGPTSTGAASLGIASSNPQQAGLRGSPGIDVHVPENRINPGETNEVTLQISNDGSLTMGTSEGREIVTTARNVRVEADADGTPLTVETGQTAIGAVTETEPGEVQIAVNVPRGTDPGTYEIDVEVRYSHTRTQDGGVTHDRTRTVTRSVELEVHEDARFTIRNATTNTSIGDRGTLSAEIENVGADTAHDLSVALESESSGLAFGEQASDAARVDRLDPGDTTTVTYDVAFAGDAPVREYGLDGTVTFETPDGYDRVDTAPSVGVEPLPKQRFSIDDVDAELRVGEDGDVTGTVVNEGPTEARNVVVRYADDSPNLIPIETTVAVGTLAPGETGDFRLPIEVGSEAEAVSRAVDVSVQYRNADLERRAYEDVELLVDIDPKRDRFTLDVRDREIVAGDTIAFEVDVTNQLDQEVRDVEARLFASSPLDSDDDEAFVESLAPGETTTMTFELSADAGATPKTHPVSFDFRYDDERGNSQLSDTTRVPVTVLEDEGGIPWSLVIVGVVLLIAAGVGYYLYARGA